MTHIFCHDKTAHRRCGTQHHKDCHQFLLTEAKHHGDRQKDGCKTDQLNRSCCNRRPDILCRALCLKRRTHRNQAERRCKYRNILHRFLQNHRLWNAKHRPEKSCSDPEDNRVCHDIFRRLFHKICRDLLPFRTEYCKNDNRHDIIQRHTADDHQRRHAGISVDILDKGNTKDRRTAPVRRLDKFASCTSLF